jgi:cyclin-dependent kinase
MGVDLLARLLQYDPQKRISASEALEHPYFDELKTNPQRVCTDVKRIS